MKTTVFTCMALFLIEGTILAQSNEAYHTFTEVKGHTIQARIIDYNTNTGKLWIENDAQKRTWVDASKFCPDDQNYLKHWLDSRNALAGKSIRIFIEPKTGTLLNAGSTRTKRYQQSKYHSVINIEKRSDIPVQGLRIEYRYFVENEVETDDAPKQYGGEFSVANMTKGESTAFSTPPIKLINEFDNDNKLINVFGTGYGEALVRQDRLLGVWLKVHGSSPNGIPIVRDICIPENLYEKVIWNNKAIALPPVSKLP